ncbi:MAG: class I SAM-dependent methyltransferase [Candidatus Wildermuthbacteria bacterium]|nr:class I SAM-dependent methyltransferase [Candidatus Wildermuthbacteria bacterium]
MDQNYAKYLLDKTREDYNLIAEDFSRTRNYLPEDIKGLGEYIEDGDRVLDFGCGNGRLYEVSENKKADFYGVDNSERLIEIAKIKDPQGKFFLSTAFSLSFPDCFFDKVYSLSVLHHVPSESLRLKFLQEAKRVLKPGGILILRVWDFWRKKGIWRFVVKFALLKLFGKSKLDINDIFLPWKDSRRKVLTERYFHCFTKAELERLFLKAGFKIKKSWQAGQGERGNIYIIAEK